MKNRTEEEQLNSEAVMKGSGPLYPTIIGMRRIKSVKKGLKGLTVILQSVSHIAMEKNRLVGSFILLLSGVLEIQHPPS